MGMFGNRPGAMGPRFTGDVQMGPQMDMSALAPMPQIAAPRPSFFAQGGVGRGIAGALGDTLLGLAHQQPIYAPAMQQKRQWERDDQRYQSQFEAQQARLNAPQIVNLGNGGIARVGPNGQPEILREPTPDEPKTPLLQQNFEWLKGLPEADQRLAATMLPGYALTPQGIATSTQRAEAVAAAGAKARAAYRAPPRPRAAPKPPAGFILD